MIANPTPALLDSLYWITLIAVIVSSASGVLKAGFKQFDLFGVIIIAIATGLGGGSLRDMLLDREVFWIRDQVFFIASLASASAIVIFIIARMTAISPRFFLVADAAGLATFGVAGTMGGFASIHRSAVFKPRHYHCRRCSRIRYICCPSTGY